MIVMMMRMSGFLCLFISSRRRHCQGISCVYFRSHCDKTASPLCRGHWGRGRGQTGMGAGVRLDLADVKLYKSAGAVREY